jgi:CHAP domain-containing protein
MSVESVMARIAEINGILAPPRAEPPPPATTFGTALDQATATAGAPAAAPLGWNQAAGGSPGQRMLAAAQAEVGQAEQPPGSNDSPRIAEYRSATAGGGVGPWCSYFVSWAARQAGAPVGEQGQGFASVSALYAWGERTGRALPAGSTPQPGDIIVWGGRHIGMVENVLPDGSIQTIEGNSSDQVSRRTYGPDGGGATGYVRLG